MASSKGFWAQLLGVGDFYYELGVQIVEVEYHTNDKFPAVTPSSYSSLINYFLSGLSSYKANKWRTDYGRGTLCKVG